MTESEVLGEKENLTEKVQAEPQSEEQQESQTKENGIAEEQKPDSEKKKGNDSEKIINHQYNLFDLSKRGLELLIVFDPYFF